MKKSIFILAVFALFAVSCNSDDDNASSQDALIGTWKYSQYLKDGVPQELEPCEDFETVAVLSNGTFTSTDYEDLGNGCEVDDTSTGTWENMGSNAYKFTIEGESNTEQINFSANTMYIEEIYEGVTHRDVYIRQ